LHQSVSGMAVFQIIAAVMAVMLIPMCMICCNRLAISLIMDNEDDSDPSAKDERNLEIAHKLIVKVSLLSNKKLE